LIYVSLLIAACHYLIHIKNDYLDALVKTLILIAAYTPLLFYIERKTNIISLFFGHIKEKIAKFKPKKQ
jgi:hypothetical protein